MIVTKTFPGDKYESVTPDDNAKIDETRGIYVGTAGDLHVLGKGGFEATFQNLAAGVIHPIAAVRVFSTGTTATGIIAVR